MRLAAIIAVIASATTCASAQSKAPVDKPQAIRSEKQYQALEKAIAPYVAKARATYPAAKKRFLAGLPPNYLFTVWLPFDERDKKTKEHRREYLFVLVEKISGGKVYGRINNTILGLKNHHYGDRVQFPESRIQNWCIVRPDGSEEGNYVGNFLDYWKPPKG
ncbi:MAG TPA: DUF2314 domain-containing protein [Chthoniobacterales bacterium]|nr:DUF2314 domain-containing protein [Chthoniobacterales bacterium]